MIDIELELAPIRYQEDLEVIATNIKENQDLIQKYNNNLIDGNDLTSFYRAVNPYINYGILDINSGRFIESSLNVTYNTVLEDSMQIRSSVSLSEGVELLLYITEEDLYTLVKTNIIPAVRNIRLDNNGYIWIKEVINYEGGENYAIRKVHANLIETEGDFLSTKTEDECGNKLYEPFDWIIATGVYVDDMDAELLRGQEARFMDLLNKLIIIGSVLLLAVGLLWLKRKLTHDRRRFFKSIEP